MALPIKPATTAIALAGHCIKFGPYVGSRHEGFRRRAKQKLGLLSLLGDSELHLIFTTAGANLLAVHNAMNNFYNEPPFAQRLRQISEQNQIPASAQYAVVEAVTTCAVGNPWGVSNAAMPSYEKMIQPFSPNEVGILLNFGSLPATIVGNRIKNQTSCRKRFAQL